MNKSSRYQTKRKQELKEKRKKFNKLFKQYEQELANLEEGTDKYKEIKLKYDTILNSFKVPFTKDLTQTFIPLRKNKKVVYYVREKHCFRQKWVDMFGKSYLENRIKKYKSLLPYKPKEVVYWNPFDINRPIKLCKKQRPN